MSESVAIISNVEITIKEFAEFLITLGAELDSENSYRSRLSEGDSHVWIFFSNRTLDEFDNLDEKNKIKQSLHGDARTCIILEMSKKASSEKLAIKLALAFSERWNCIVYNLLDTIYSKKDLNQLLISDRSFSGR